MTLPAGWAIARIDELAGPDGLVVDGDWVESKDQDPAGEVRLTQLADVGDGDFLDRSARHMTRDAARRLNCTFLRPGDVLIARMPDPIGRACIFPGTEQPAVTVVDVMIWRTDHQLATSEWFAYWINSPMVRAAMAAMAGGTTRQRVAGARVKALELPFPPPAEQRRIVAKLDALSARLASARAELHRALQLRDRLRLLVLRAGVSGNLTARWRSTAVDIVRVETLLQRIPAPQQGRGGREATDKVIPGVAGLSVNDPGTLLPDGWKWVPLLRLAKQETGHTPSRSEPSYWDGGVPWIGIRDAGAHHGRHIEQTFQTISEAGLANSSARLLPPRTVCLSRTASIGYVTIMARSMATSQDFATWTCTEALVPEYLMYALMAEGEDIRKFGMGSTHTTIYFPEIRALHIALPPVEEQREIVTRIKSALNCADRVEAEAARARALLDRLESAILAQAFRGELVPQDPNDEPASVLLERIRAERAAAATTKRKRRLDPSSVKPSRSRSAAPRSAGR
jgi:type I restriction enzyme S subunit